jgi:chaperonin GroES
MSIQPTGDRVLVKVQESESKTKGGLYIPDSAKKKTSEGVVSAIGPDSSVTVKVGDKVMFDQYAGSQVQDDSGAYLLLRIDDIIAVVT